MRVSYCCMSSIGAIIKAHNSKILNEKARKADEPCNCRKRECPFINQGVSCRTRGVIYKVEVKTRQSCKSYIGLCEGEFKDTFNNHMSSFNPKRNVKLTILASYIRNLNHKNEDYDIHWSVVGRASAIKDGDATCRLCLKEATTIAFAGAGCINQ